MTEEEGLANLAQRAHDRNLWFGPTPLSPVSKIAIISDTSESYAIGKELKNLFGGKICAYNDAEYAQVNALWRNTYKYCWALRDEEAAQLINKLLPRKDFRTSGKYEFASEALQRWKAYLRENNRNAQNITR